MQLSNLPPSELQALKAQLDGLTDTSGRSPLRPRQLHDLTLHPTATDPRPTFFWSAESPRTGTIGPPTLYPKLLWQGETGQEITVYSAGEEQTKLAQGYVTTAPTTRVSDPVTDLSDQLSGLSDEEQTLILEAQAKIRRDALTARLAALSDAEIDRLLAGKAPTRKRKVA